MIMVVILFSTVKRPWGPCQRNKMHVNNHKRQLLLVKIKRIVISWIHFQYTQVASDVKGEFTTKLDFSYGP